MKIRFYSENYDYKLIEYYENKYGANKIKVLNNNSIREPTFVMFYKENSLLKSPIKGEETTLGLYRYLEENTLYLTKNVKEIIRKRYEKDCKQ